MRDGGRLTPGLLDERRPPVDHPVAQALPPRPRPAWFAGCNLRILAQTPSEGPFYDALGLGVLLLSCLSGFAVFFSIGYVLEEQAAAIAIGVAWAVVLSCGIERLLLQVAGSRDHLGALAIAVIPRVFISLLIGFVLAEPLLLKVFEPEVDNYIGNQQRLESRQLIEQNEKTYGGRLDQIVGELNEIEIQEGRLKQDRIQLRQQLDECTTPAECTAAAAKLGVKEGRLREIQDDNATERVPGLEAKRDRLRGLLNDDERGRNTIKESDGVLARIEAAGALAKEHTAMNVSAWVLRLLFVCIDLLPLTIKVTRILSFDSPYELRSAAARDRDALAAEGEELHTDVIRTDLRNRAREEKRVNQATATADAEQRIYETAGAESHANPPPASPTMSLDEFVDSISIHEERPVEVPEELRRSALIGLALLGTSAILGLLVASAVGISSLGGWFLMAVFALAVTLCAFTRGFNEAPVWAMRPILWIFICGLGLPPLVLLVSLA